MVFSLFDDVFEKQKNCKDDYNVVFETIRKMVELSSISREKDKFKLENTLYAMIKEDNEPDDATIQEYGQYKMAPLNRMLYKMMMCIIDGRSHEDAISIGKSCYISSGFQGREALAAYIIYYGCLDIYELKNPRIIEDELISFLSPDIEDEYIKIACEILDDEKNVDRAVYMDFTDYDFDEQKGSDGNEPSDDILSIDEIDTLLNNPEN